MKKSHKIIYWIATIWMAFGMTFSGVAQLINMEENVTMMAHLGYPPYLLKILGVSKILGVIAILIPKFPVLKEWAYAGFVFTVVGAAISHIIMKDGFTEILPTLLFMVLIALSWYFRPPGRKTAAASA